MRGGPFIERDKLLRMEVIYPYIPRRNGINPAVEIDAALAQLKHDGWMCAQMIELDADILLGRPDEAIIACHIRVELTLSGPRDM